MMNQYCKIKELLFVAFVALSNVLSGQVKIPAASQQLITELRTISQAESYLDWSEENTGKYPIHHIQNRHYLSTLAKVSSDFKASLLPDGMLVGTRIGDIITLKIPLDQLSDINRLEGVEYLEVSGKIQPHLDKVIIDTRADSVHRAIDFGQAYTGKDVIIGVTDWGFDYTHPMFYDTSLNSSRILAAWDQFKNAGTPPTGFNYGTEHLGATALSTAESDTACTYYDYATHGTHVAGIAAGGGAGLGLKGMAFESNLLFVQIYLDAAAAIDAVDWMKAIAENEQKRLVVNMSWGLYHLGPLDGTSLLSQALDNFSDNGVVIVTSNGNNGGDNFHIVHDFNHDTIQTKVDFYNYSAHPSMWGQSISMWGEANGSFSAAIEVYNGTTLLVKSPYYHTTSAAAYLDSSLITGTDTIFFNVTTDASYPSNKRPHMRLRVKNTNTSLSVILKSYASEGIVHYWNVTELSNGAGNWGMPFSPFGTGGVKADFAYGIGEPSCAKSVISVGAHASETKFSGGVIRNGILASFSSRGPTMDGRVKPDISAPGVSVTSSLSSFTTESHGIEETTMFNGRTYNFAKFSGTSMASPAAAGVVALMLDANPALTPSEVKTILKSSARTDNRTGIIPSTGSTDWGWGKVTATAAVKAAIQYTAVNELGNASSVAIYPNPASDHLTVRFDKMTSAG